MIEILTSGALNSVQDGGRTGHLTLGVSHCGAMDRLALEAGNALLGNARDAAAIETAYFPFRLRFLADTTVAVTGADCAATIDGAPMPPWWARPAKAGQTLTLSRPIAGARAYVCLAGGLDAPEVMGSRSTDLKTGFGGHFGRGLLRGDRLATLGVSTGCHALDAAGLGASPTSYAEPPGRGAVTVLRTLPAAEHDEFEPSALSAFYGADWAVSKDANRSGYRLDGPVLRRTVSRDLLSHGIVPGTVQVPPSGQPIIQLADANTCGGYPKIATVVTADLWRLAQSPVGQTLRFLQTTRDEAVAALRTQQSWIADLRRTARLLTQ